jgi:parallel beta-helix repeat protein
MASSGEEPWQGIGIYNGGKGEIDHLELSGAKVGIAMIASEMAITASRISGAEKAIHLVKEATARMEGCIFKDNQVGLAVEMKSTGYLKNSALVKNQAGVGIASGGNIDILQSSFSGNKVGVSVLQRFPGKIAGNLFEDNQVGVRLEQNGPDTLIEKNVFVNSAEAAVQALSYTSPTIRNNRITGGRYGLVAHMFSKPAVLNNRFEKMDEAIHLNKKSSATVTGNIIARSKVGIFLDFSSYPDARDNRFEGNELHVKLGRFQSSHWEAAAGSKQIVMRTAAQAKSRNPQLAKESEKFPEAVILSGNWWDDKTRGEMDKSGVDGNVPGIYDGHDLPEVTYEGFGEEKYRLDKVVYLPILADAPEEVGLKGWQGGKDELGF